MSVPLTAVFAVWNATFLQWIVYPSVQAAVDTEGDGCIIYTLTPSLLGTGHKTVTYGTT